MKNLLLSSVIALSTIVSAGAFAESEGIGDRGNNPPSNPGPTCPNPSSSSKYGNYATEGEARIACSNPTDRVYASYKFLTNEVMYWTCAPGWDGPSEGGGGR